MKNNVNRKYFFYTGGLLILGIGFAVNEFGLKSYGTYNYIGMGICLIFGISYLRIALRK